MDEQIQLSSIISSESILDIDVKEESSSYIKVVGVGGAGTNAVNHMFNKGINGVDLYVCNTDATSLNASPVKNKVSIGKLGAGNDSKKGKKAAEENQDKINEIFDQNTRMLFVTAGMGGGTGTGASPVVAKLAKDIVLPEDDEKILVVGVVTLPFSFEGRKRRKQAEEGIKELKAHVDCMIIVNTDKLLAYKDLEITTAFALADDILFTAVKGISEIMTNVGRVQVDFRDVQSVMSNGKVALMGMGVAEGENRALEAIKAATTSELLNDNDISKTKNVLITFTCSKEAGVTTTEMEAIQEYITEQTNEDVDLIWGFSEDESFGGKLGITFIATGFEFKDIYTPTTRIPKHEGSVPAPDAPLIDTQSDDMISRATQELEQSAKSNDGMEEMRIINKSDVKAETPVEEPKVQGRTVIRVDENIRPINQNAESNFQNAVLTNQNEVSSYQDIHLKEQPAFRQVEAVETVVETPEIAVVQAQNPAPKPQVQETVGGLRSAIDGESSLGTAEVYDRREIADKDFADRLARIQKIKEQMSTPEGLNQIINSHPTPENNYDCTNTFSSPKSQSTLSVNNSGNIELRNNFAIDSQVD